MNFKLLEQLKHLVDQNEIQVVKNQLNSLELDTFSENILKILILEKSNQINDALNTINRLDNFNDDLAIQFIYGVVKSSLLWRTSNYDDALQLAKKSNQIYSNLDNSNLEIWYRDLHRNLGVIYVSKGELDLGLDYLNSSLEINNKLPENQKFKASILNNIGIIYIQKGNPLEAISILDKSKNIFIRLEDYESLTYLLNNLGGIYFSQGNFDIALLNFEIALDYSIKNDNKEMKAKILNNLGNLYVNFGEYEKALFYYSESKLIKQEIEDIHGLYYSNHNIGQIYRKKGDYGLALHHLDDALEIQESINNDIEISNTLSEIILTYTSQGNMEKAKLFFTQLTHINKNNKDNIHINLYYNFAHAMIMKKSNLHAYKLAAITQFEKILKKPIVNFEITALSILNLIELKIEFYYYQPNSNLLNNLDKTIDIFYKMSQKYNSLINIINSLLLKSKIKLMQNQNKLAKTILYQLEILSKEKNLKRLNIEIIEEINNSEHLIDQPINSSVSDAKKIEKSHFNLLVNNILAST